VHILKLHVLSTQLQQQRRTVAKRNNSRFTRVIIQRWLSVWDGARKWTRAAPGSMRFCRGVELSSAPGRTRTG